ncbi:MAG: polyprenyl synthetase family protein [Trueperaceae bacterium]|nr:polyprenyl synthetase family protein [Trueperaceae bacterium]
MFEIIQDDLAAFEKRLASELQSSVAFISAIGEDLVGAGGKRLRPSLAFLAGRLLGTGREQALQVAVAVELLHSASLLHDDLIDDATTRRGHEAAFRRYGNVVSVMSGDYMLARVLGVLAQADHAGFTALMSQTAAQICEAEVLQFQMASLETYAFASYDKIIEGKTAALVSAALEGVAMLARAPEADREALRRYGLHYGRAFQMQDDYLDLLGSEAQLGKPVGGDLREGKATYPVLLLLDDGVEEAGAILRRHAGTPGDVARMIALVEEYGADVRTREQIVAEATRALAALERFAESEAKEGLEHLARREIERIR